jgi:hypothetical protein
MHIEEKSHIEEKDHTEKKGHISSSSLRKSMQNIKDWQITNKQLNCQSQQQFVKQEYYLDPSLHSKMNSNPNMRYSSNNTKLGSLIDKSQ